MTRLNREEKQVWLDGLREGDRVLITSRHFKGITTIEKITKTRRIKVKNGQQFNSDGSQYGRGTSWNYFDIDPVTDEVLLEFKMKRLISKMEAVNWKLVNYGDLKKIAGILGFEP